MDKTIAVLSEDLTATYRGRELPEKYRAVLQLDYRTMKLGVRVEQPIKGEWCPTGASWYLSSLLEGGMSDSISIDFGQQWGISAGFEDALKQAIKSL